MSLCNLQRHSDRKRSHSQCGLSAHVTSSEWPDRRSAGHCRKASFKNCTKNMPTTLCMLWLGLPVCLFLTADASGHIIYDDVYKKLTHSLPWMQERRRYAKTECNYTPSMCNALQCCSWLKLTATFAGSCTRCLRSSILRQKQVLISGLSTIGESHKSCTCYFALHHCEQSLCCGHFARH